MPQGGFRWGRVGISMGSTVGLHNHVSTSQSGVPSSGTENVHEQAGNNLLMLDGRALDRECLASALRIMNWAWRSSPWVRSKNGA